MAKAFALFFIVVFSLAMIHMANVDTSMLSDVVEGMFGLLEGLYAVLG